MQQEVTTEVATKEQIRQFVLEDLARRKGINDFSDDELLIQNGIVDSLGIFRLVSFFEEKFRLRIPDEEINADNFQTINTMAQYVVSHLKKLAPSNV